jgi:nucleoside-diphosphate-sugar epimerase
MRISSGRRSFAMTEQRVAVITGGSGFIGRHLVRHLEDAGWEVRAPARAQWDLGRPLGPLLDGADVVVHGASVPYDQPRASELNRMGTRLILGEVRGRTRVRLVFLSSLSARSGATSQYGNDKFELQSLLAGPSELAIRPGLVLGDAGLFDRIRRIVARGGIVPLVGGGQMVQTVHVDDLVAAIVVAIDRELDGVIAVAESRPVTFRALLVEAARQMDVRVRFAPVPFWAVDAGLRTARALRLRLPVSSENLSGLRSLQPEDVAADESRLGIPIRDYRASLAAIIGKTSR